MSTKTPPFVWDRNYDNTEQVRPYLADFMVLKNAGFFYNDDFKGKIPGLANSANEDTGIYLLQNLARLDELRERTRAFIAAGGYALPHHTPMEIGRGTLVRAGFYMCGTGWSEKQVAAVKVDERDTVYFKEPRQKNWRTHYDGPSSYLFMPES